MPPAVYGNYDILSDNSINVKYYFPFLVNIKKGFFIILFSKQCRQMALPIRRSIALLPADAYY